MTRNNAPRGVEADMNMRGRTSMTRDGSKPPSHLDSLARFSVDLVDAVNVVVAQAFNLLITSLAFTSLNLLFGADFLFETSLAVKL